MTAVFTGVVSHSSCASYQQEFHHALPGLLHEGGVSLDLHAWASRHRTGRNRLGALLDLYQTSQGCCCTSVIAKQRAPAASMQGWCRS